MPQLSYSVKLEESKKNILFSQGVPLMLTAVIFVVLVGLIYFEIKLLNLISARDILTQIRIQDVLVGMTIYLKTSVDFAIFIGNLMTTYNRIRHRIAIEIGTAFGNALGTMLILMIWNFFRNIQILLAIMVFIASLVLLRLAEDGLEHVLAGGKNIPIWFTRLADRLESVLESINQRTGRILNFIIPNISLKPKLNLTFLGLFVASFSIPFILGLDDFAGYVPLFNIVNVFGFAIGVLAGHMILNIFLFISPSRTISIVKNPIISFAGSIAFILLAILGFFEVYKLIFVH